MVLTCTSSLPLPLPLAAAALLMPRPVRVDDYEVMIPINLVAADVAKLHLRAGYNEAGT